MSLPRGCRVPGYVATSTRQDPANAGSDPRRALRLSISSTLSNPQ
jgi:hypothetical protein